MHNTTRLDPIMLRFFFGGQAGEAEPLESLKLLNSVIIEMKGPKIVIRIVIGYFLQFTFSKHFYNHLGQERG